MTVVPSVLVLNLLICVLGDASTKKGLPGNLKGELQEAMSQAREKNVKKTFGAQCVPPL